MSYLARNNYTGDGSTKDFTVSFPYLASTHVKVYLAGVLKTLTTDYSWLNSTTIRMVTAPVLGAALSIRRDTSSAARLVDYVSGSSLNEADLDTDSLQAFYLSQEGIDDTIAVAFADQIAFTPSGTLSSTNVQTALVELDTEKSPTTHTHAAATSSVAGFMAATDKSKLDGIGAGAQVNSVTTVAGRVGAIVLTKADVGLSLVDNTSDISKPVSNAMTVELNSKSNTGHIHDNATESVAGFMSAADKAIIDGLSAGGVASIFTRTGAVVAVAGDYNASKITNDSGVTGAFVKDALNTLNTGKQATDADLTAISAISGTGILARTAADTWAVRTLTAPAAGITVSNGGGVAGDPTLALANDLAALEGLGSTGFAVRSAANTWVQRTMAVGAGITVSNSDGVAGNPTFSPDINGLTVDSAPDVASDYLMSYDASATALKKVLLRNAGFASGTAMLFVQASAPTGWTKSITHNDKALRIVSGSGGGSGGSSAFSTVHGITTTQAFTLTTGEMPSHQHTVDRTASVASGGSTLGLVNAGVGTSNVLSELAGSGGSHSHNIDLRIQYVDAIICTKD